MYVFKMRLVTVTGKNERSAPSTFTQAVAAANASFFRSTTTQIQGRSPRRRRRRRRRLCRRFVDE